MHIGISKEFNNFELRRAIGEKYVKAIQISKYFSDNPNSNFSGDYFTILTFQQSFSLSL